MSTWTNRRTTAIDIYCKDHGEPAHSKPNFKSHVRPTLQSVVIQQSLTHCGAVGFLRFS